MSWGSEPTLMPYLPVRDSSALESERQSFADDLASGRQCGGKNSSICSGVAVLSHVFIKCIWFDLQCVNFCCTAKWFGYTNIYTHSFSYSFPLRFIKGCWISFLVLYSRALLFIHSMLLGVFLVCLFFSGFTILNCMCHLRQMMSSFSASRIYHGAFLLFTCCVALGKEGDEKKDKIHTLPVSTVWRVTLSYLMCTKPSYAFPSPSVPYLIDRHHLPELHIHSRMYSQMLSKSYWLQIPPIFKTHSLLSTPQTCLISTHCSSRLLTTQLHS